MSTEVMWVKGATVVFHLYLIISLLLCLHFCLVLGCGQCKGQCDKENGVCTDGCRDGWRGIGCTYECQRTEDCINPCRCQMACQCDPQFLICNDTYCLYAAASATMPSMVSLTMMMTTMAAGIVVMVGLVMIGFWVIMKRGQTTHGLRGRLLSNPCCAHCPQLRDCLQRCGEAVGLPGLQLGARDSLDTIAGDDECMAVQQSMAFRYWRRQKATVVGVRMDTHLPFQTATSGYRWKKKWRDRKKASKAKRKLKHEQRKLRRLGIEPKRGSIILPPPSRTRTLPPSSSPSSNPPRRGSTIHVNLLNLFRRGSLRERTDDGRDRPANASSFHIPIQQVPDDGSEQGSLRSHATSLPYSALSKSSNVSVMSRKSDCVDPGHARRSPIEAASAAGKTETAVSTMLAVRSFTGQDGADTRGLQTREVSSSSRLQSPAVAHRHLPAQDVTSSNNKTPSYSPLQSVSNIGSLQSPTPGSVDITLPKLVLSEMKVLLENPTEQSRDSDCPKQHDKHPDSPPQNNTRN